MYLLPAFGAEAFEDVGGGVEVKAFGEGDGRYTAVAQAESAAAVFAEEVGMEVAKVLVDGFAAVAIGWAEGILRLSRPVVDRMDEVVGEEEREGTEYAGLIDRQHSSLKVGEGKGTLGLFKGTER